LTANIYLPALNQIQDVKLKSNLICSFEFKWDLIKSLPIVYRTFM
jgi:hypothetical protein